MIVLFKLEVNKPGCVWCGEVWNGFEDSAAQLREPQGGPL